MADTPHVRPMTTADLEAVRPLLAQLGYDLAPDEVRRRFAAITSAAGHAVFVAETAGRVVGMMHLFARPAFDKPPETVVQAIVVDAAHRGRGVGKILMEAAEDWAAQRGYRSVSLYSKRARADAHAFYHALGYEKVATSHLLRRDLRTAGSR
jgi:GNAT superfamily N-acetyltransferase